ncbi:uncharacterized protein LOC100845383 [Brachypodium distachyon]|uniref:Pectinesterase inhibitor domain-containing protein n=1 Tax=Brachypodium distachyon TaxID=15368 RepID=A0A2K2DEG2_BRADI|nr:uncharacterized protein LOC100845383 [Brachypodium distachyon]PNT72672.1 hypothetical protein BRADI_2g47631v3 [Brachypodium distachyon]|eukprot:XP_003567035.1 uncharacterized protein LOC100845383 [Brachypodium distachyon]
MLRHLAALILAAVLTASTSSTDAARAFRSNGRRLIGVSSQEDCIAICQQVHYKTLCSTLATLPGVTTPQLLLEAALRVAAAKAALAEMRLDVAMKAGGAAMGNAMSSSLQSCKDSYASLVDALETSRATLRDGGRKDDLMSELSAAGTYSTDCQDIFDERPELKLPIPGTQRHVTRLVSNCIDLAATIKQP